MNPRVYDLLDRLRRSGMHAPAGEARENNHKIGFLAELPDRTGGWFLFDPQHIEQILARLQRVKITEDKDKSSKRMLHALESIEREIRAHATQGSS